MQGSGKHERIATRTTAKHIIVSISLIAACIALGALLNGLLAWGLQATIMPLFGIRITLGILNATAAITAVLAYPLFTLALANAIAPLNSHPQRNRPRLQTRRLPSLYAATLFMTTITTMTGAAAWLLCNLVPFDLLRYAIAAVLAAVLGTLHIVTFKRVWVAVRAGTPAPEALRALIPALPASFTRRANQTIACILSLSLAFSLFGNTPIAFADPTTSEGGTTQTTPDIYEPPASDQAPATTPSGSAGENDPRSDSSNATTQATRTTPSATDAAPDQQPDSQAPAPLDYYGTDSQTEGDVVYTDDQVTIFQTDRTAFTTVIGGTAQAYLDKNGDPQRIDNTLEAKDVSWFNDDVIYENRANSFTAALPDKMDEGRGLVIEKDDHRIELIPEEGDFSRSAAEGTAVRYTEVAPGIDYQYTLVGSLVKEDIILNQPTEQRTFATRLKLSEGLSASLENGIVVVRDLSNAADESNEPAEPDTVTEPADQTESDTAPESTGAAEVLSIAAPIATDAGGQISNDVSLRLETNANGETIIYTDPDWAWLSHPDRAFPVRIDPTIDVASSSVRVACVEQRWHDQIIGENGYSYAGYDDGVKTGTGDFNHGLGHAICRVYASINYDFRYIMSEARIDSATFSLYQGSTYSGGATNFGLFRIMDGWDPNNLTWDAQVSLRHEAIDYQRARTSRGYVNWDVREAVNNWIQNVYPQFGLCVKAENESSQCELFENRFSSTPPKMEINWVIPDPVDEAWSLNNTTVNLRTITEHDANNKLQLDGVFTDGMATPRSLVSYTLDPAGQRGVSYASRNYKYPDSSSWQDQVPNGTRYKDKLSNWQSGVFSNLSYNTVYVVRAAATLVGQTGTEATSDTFLVYKASLKDTLPYIANHYGVTLETLAKDNRVQDSLVVNGNTIFVRNPKTNVAYNPTTLTEDQKRRIDSALMGRGKHCEYGFEPVNMNTGNFMLEATDATLPEIEGDFTLMRTYNSKNEGAQSLLGRNWSFAFAEQISQSADGSLVYTAGDGKTLWFTPDGKGGYTCPDGFDWELKRIPYAGEPDADGVRPTLHRFELHATDGSYRCFNGWGLLTDLYSAQGLHTALAYDASMQLTSITSPTGRVFGVKMDGRGHIGAVTLPDGNTVRYTYDNNDNLVSVVDATGATLRYEYDARNRMTAWYDAAGTRVVKNVYDAQGRVVRQYDAAGHASSLSYATHATTATDANSNTTIYRYDDQMRTTSITYADGWEVTRTYGANNTLTSDEQGTYRYDANGNLTAQTTPEGRTTTWEYDERNRVTRTTTPDGDVTTYTYDAFGNQIRESHTSGQSFEREYDTMGRLTAETDADGVRTTYTWRGALMTSSTDGLGNTTRYGYDAMGRCVSETDALGNISRTTYDALGRITSQTDAEGARTSYRLTAAGLLASATDPRGATTTFTYDSTYNIASMTDSTSATTTYTYDACGNQLSETNALGATSRTEYDSRHRVSASIDAEGNRTEYAWDGRGRRTCVTLPSGATEQTTYEGTTANIASITDANGNTTAYTYDNTGNLASITYPDGTGEQATWLPGQLVSTYQDAVGTVSTLAYSSAGRLLSADQAGHLTSYAYDDAGNMTATTDAAGNTSTFEYDAASRMVRVTGPTGATAQLAYDGADRVIAATDAAGNTATYEYDAAGNTVAQTDAAGNTERSTYDSEGRLTAHTDALGRTTTYTYDAAGNRTSTTDAAGGVRTTAYDKADRPIAMTDALARTTHAAYDAAGNITRITLPSGTAYEYTYDAVGNLTHATDPANVSIEYAYDARDRLIAQTSSATGQQTFSYDGAGRTTAATDALGRTARMAYDAWGNIIEETDFDGTTATYEYDAMGNMTAATDALGNTTAYEYDARSALLASVLPQGARTAYAYDACGNLIRQMDPTGYARAFTYDAVGNAIQEIDEDGFISTYAYDAAAQLTSVTDALGRTTTITYDALGNLTALTRPEGDTNTFAYDAEGQLIAHTDGRDNTRTFAYDIMGNMVATTDAEGAQTTYAYDAHGNVTSSTDAAGNTTTYEISPADTVLAQVQPNGARYTYEYDSAGRLTALTTPKGYTRTFEYGTADVVMAEHDNMGAQQTYAYDALSRMIAATDATGATTAYEYDARGNLTHETDRTGAATTYAYDLADRLIGTTDARGTTAQLSYDGRGNVVEQRIGSATATLSYDEVGNLVASTDARGNQRTFAYDGNDRLTQATDATGALTTYAYDAADNLIQETDPLGRARSYEYDATDRLVRTTDRTEATTAYEYDATGNLTGVEAADGTRATYAYDSMGNLTQITDALGRVRSYTYDEENNLTAITSPSGAVEQLEYDMQSRVQAAIAPNGATTRYDYDALNNLVEKSYSTAPDQSVLYSYDAEGRITDRADPTGESSFKHDELGRITAETDGQGRTLRYGYDALGNLTTLTYPDGTQVAYAYDQNGNIIQVATDTGTYDYTYDEEDRPTHLTRPDGTQTTYVYDEAGQLTSMTTTGPAGPLSSYAYTYDGEGNIATETSTMADTTGAAHATLRTFTYTADGKLASCEQTADGTWSKESYAYDACGNRTAVTREGDQAHTTTYAYDADDRLIRSTSTNSGTTTYTYDEAGNLTAQQADDAPAIEYAYGVENRLEAVREGGRLLMAATYDGDGNRVLQTNIYHTQHTETDPGSSGNNAGSGADEDAFEPEGVPINTDLATTGSIDLFWYGFGATAAACLASADPALIVPAAQLGMDIADVLLPKHARSLPLSLPDYALDQLSRIGLAPTEEDAVKRTLGIIPRTRNVTDTNYDIVSYMNSSVTEVSQVMSATSTRSGTSYEVYGLERLASISDTSITSYVYDGRGSVAQTVNVQAQVTSWRTYDPFGEPDAGSAWGELPAYGYNAEEYNPTTQLQYLRARYYNPTTAVFGTADSLLGEIANPLTLNRYLYCIANPITYSDPTGHKFSIGTKVFSVLASYGFAKPPGPASKAIAAVKNLQLTVTNTWKGHQALRAGDTKKAAQYYSVARMYQQIYQNLYCGSAKYITYDRNNAIDYARIFSQNGRFTGYYDGYFLLNGRNPLYPSFPQNCANFVSQVLTAGGFQQNAEWNIREVVLSYREGVYGWEPSRAWSLALDQYKYFSDPTNGYANGNVINVYKTNEHLSNNQINVSLTNLSSDLKNLNVQKGDLMYFYNNNGVHHATVISEVTDTEIKYSGNTSNRFNYSLNTSLNSSTDSGVFIVRLKNNIEK